MNTSINSPELLLDVGFAAGCTIIFRTTTEDGAVLYFEKSDIIDYNKPVGHEEEMPLYYSLESVWKSVLGFTSAEAFLKRSAWHEESMDWLKMKPQFIGTNIRPLIMRSLSKASNRTEDLTSDQVDGLRAWIKEVSADQPIRMNRTPKATSHVYAKRA